MRLRIVRKCNEGNDCYVVERLRDFVLFKMWINEFYDYYCDGAGISSFDRTFNTVEDAEKAIEELEHDLKYDNCVVKEIEFVRKRSDVIKKEISK